jgi:DNA mismatch endonuclease (patch repair protein)
VDSLTPSKRSENMSRIRGRDTKPEKALRSALHRLGYRFRVTSRNLPGRPDIVLRKHCAVIFVHGCFWHRHRNCSYAYVPKTNRTFWSEKFEGNKKRDRLTKLRLRKLGWRVLVVWECGIRDKQGIARSAARSARWLNSKSVWREIQ